MWQRGAKRKDKARDFFCVFVEFFLKIVSEKFFIRFFQ